MSEDEKPKKFPYRRENKDNPTVFEPPPPPPREELTGEEVDERLAVLDRIGTRIINHHGKHCVTTPIVPPERMMQALADLEMDLEILLIRSAGNGTMDLYFTMLEKGWLKEWQEDGWQGLSKIIRRNSLLMEAAIN